MLNKIFDGFNLKEKSTEDVINTYMGRVPEKLVEVWKQYGFGSILEGYLKIVNPDEYQCILEDVYVRSKEAIILFTTSMGDIIVWEDNKYLIQLNFRRGKMKGISSGFKYFFSDLEDESFLEDNLDWLPYLEAVKKLGVPNYDECFGYEPILGLGGSEKVDNLKKVKLVEHIYLIKEFMGPIE